MACPGTAIPITATLHQHGWLHRPPSNLFFCPAASWSSMAPTGLLGVCGLLCAWGAAAAGWPCGLDHQVGTGAWGRCAGGGVPDDCWSTARLAGACLGWCAAGSRRCSAAVARLSVSSSARPSQNGVCARFVSLQGAPAYTCGDTVTGSRVTVTPSEGEGPVLAALSPGMG